MAQRPIVASNIMYYTEDELKEFCKQAFEAGEEYGRSPEYSDPFSEWWKKEMNNPKPPMNPC